MNVLDRLKYIEYTLMNSYNARTLFVNVYEERFKKKYSLADRKVVNSAQHPQHSSVFTIALIVLQAFMNI